MTALYPRHGYLRDAGAACNVELAPSTLDP